MATIKSNCIILENNPLEGFTIALPAKSYVLHQRKNIVMLIRVSVTLVGSFLLVNVN